MAFERMVLGSWAWDGGDIVVSHKHAHSGLRRVNERNTEEAGIVLFKNTPHGDDEHGRIQHLSDNKVGGGRVRPQKRRLQHCNDG